MPILVRFGIIFLVVRALEFGSLNGQRNDNASTSVWHHGVVRFIAWSLGPPKPSAS
jgi:hypothetical protein